MADPSLRDIVLARLEQSTRPEDEWSALVLAALEGQGALETMLTSAPAPAPSRKPQQAKEDAQSDHPSTTHPRTAFLKSITVEGFRGIGPRATLELPPGPGLTLVVGRNGSGKSSFAEALELLLTGDTYRWSQRSKVWRDGWRNLHHPKATIAAEFALEGEKEAESLRQAAKEATKAREALKRARAEARRRMALDTALLARAEEAGLKTEADAALRHSEGAAAAASRHSEGAADTALRHFEGATWTTPEESTGTPDELATSIERLPDARAAHLPPSLSQRRPARCQRRKHLGRLDAGLPPSPLRVSPNYRGVAPVAGDHRAFRLQ